MKSWNAITGFSNKQKYKISFRKLQGGLNEVKRKARVSTTFDFAIYSIGVTIKEFGRCIKEAFGGTGEEVDDVKTDEED